MRPGKCSRTRSRKVGPEKDDETAAAMIAQLKYGSGISLYRLGATEWEIVGEAASAIKPAHEEPICQAAQGRAPYNDDTGTRVLRMEREPWDERTGRVHQPVRVDWRRS